MCLPSSPKHRSVICALICQTEKELTPQMNEEFVIHVRCVSSLCVFFSVRNTRVFSYFISLFLLLKCLIS